MRSTVREIPLKRGFKVLVDDEDYEPALAYRWHLHRAKQAPDNWYAAASFEGRTVYLHRFIAGAEKGDLVDHRNGNGLDCRRINLRLATHSQNSTNRKTWAKSGYRGVEIPPRSPRFGAYIFRPGQKKMIRLGLFDTPEAAARRYDREAVKIHGAWAKLNFPEEHR